MSASKRGYQFGSPVVISSLTSETAAQSLQRLKLGVGQEATQAYDEAWIQRLIHCNPLMLPVAELEPGLSRLIPVAMELPTPAGYLDNLFVTVEGHLVLVECKLWRNPEARRRVIAQIIDYAQSVASWNYEQLDNAIRRCISSDENSSAKSLVELVRSQFPESGEEFDEAEFIDAVQRNLRLGRMLLLVMGDGIREDTESLTDYLQQHAGFHFTLALVETALFVLPAGGFLAQARVLARTLNIERAVVSLVDGRLAVSAPAASLALRESAPARSLSEESFFEKLKATVPETATALSAFLARASDIGVFLDVATKSAVLKWSSPGGRQYSLGGVDMAGRLVTYSVNWGPKLIGRVDLGHEYLRDLANLAGAQVRQTKTEEQWYLVSTGTTMPPAERVLSKPDLWLAAIEAHQKRISAAEEQLA